MYVWNFKLKLFDNVNVLVYLEYFICYEYYVLILYIFICIIFFIFCNIDEIFFFRNFYKKMIFKMYYIIN